MKCKYFLSFALICVAIVSLMSSPAGAITTKLDAWYYSLSGLKDGQADYELDGLETREWGTRFEVEVISDDGSGVTTTQEFLNQKGTFKIRPNYAGEWGGGRFYVIKDGIAEEATSADFALTSDSELGDDWTNYKLVDDYGYEVLLIAGDLNDSIFSWNFPDMPSLDETDGTTVVFTQTQDQLEDFVPYIEFVTDDEGKATTLKWSLVSSNDTSKPLAFDFPVQVRVQQIRTYEGTTGSNVKINAGWEWFNPDTEVSGEATFDAIDVSKVFRVRLRFMTYMTPEGEEEPEEKRYEWQFINPELTQLKLSTIQRVRASFDKTGKPDYSTAKLRNLYIGVEENPTPVEYWQFLPESALAMRISGGGYSLVDETTNEVLKTIPSGQDETLKLMPLYDDGVNVGGTYWENQPYNSETKHWIDFYDDTGALKGKTVTLIYNEEHNEEYTIPQPIPKYKTVKEQLEDIVPCVELVSADGKLTQVNLRLVASNDVSTAKSPSYTTDFYARVVNISGDVVERFDWKNDTHEETWTLGKSYPLDSIQQVYIDVRSYEDSEENPSRYRWNFYLLESADAGTDSGKGTEPTTEPESESENNNIGGSGGGCFNVGFKFFELAILAAFLKKRSKFKVK